MSCRCFNCKFRVWDKINYDRPAVCFEATFGQGGNLKCAIPQQYSKNRLVFELSQKVLKRILKMPEPSKQRRKRLI